VLGTNRLTPRMARRAHRPALAGRDLSGRGVAMTASSPIPRCSLALAEKCTHSHARLSRGESRSASFTSCSVSSARLS
jgi:hypothetical protein